MHRGRSAIVRRDICNRIASILDFSSADVVCLQEVWQHEGFDYHQLEEHLCDVRWPHRVFSTTARFRLGSQGNAIVSQSPIQRWHHLDISVANREPRAMIHAVVRLDEVDAHVICVHLGLLRSERRWQLDYLLRFLNERIDRAAPLFVAGDFNDWRQELSAPFEKMHGLKEVMIERTGGHSNTYPAFWPVLALDRIYFRGGRLLDARVVKGWKCVTLSDHLPVEAEFAM
jgi:endonuclease/exonuclease/phosphatase family metal-dependent hydrolase